MKNNLLLAILGGLVAALIGAAIWAVVTVSTGYQIGWMAVGIGFLVGYAVRYLGRGSSPAFGVVGAVLAVLGCAVGNLFSGIGFIAGEAGLDFISTALQFNYAASFELLGDMFAPMDILFYGIALYEGYKFGLWPESSESLSPGEASPPTDLPV